MLKPALSAPDLTICDREPIARLESIQAFGFLLAMSRDWVIQRASDNLAALLGIPVKQALGEKVDSLLDPQALHDIRNRMLSLYLTRGTERLFGIALVKGRPRFDISVHQSGEWFILEGEPSMELTQTDAAILVRSAIARIEARETLELFHTDAARQIRSITGFDRVMVYRFDDAGNGEVIAEALSAEMESYLGLHYPASDIPQQARALYLRNPFRIIPDVREPSIPIISPKGDLEPLDLTLSVTRAVSPVHIEYLKNMGVRASMSISIIVERKLWGLIACHHSAPRLPSFVVRTSVELFAHMYSLSLESRLRDRAQRDEIRLANATKQILSSVVGDDALMTRAEWLQDVLRDVIGGSGTAIVSRGTISIAGEAPPSDIIQDILAALKAKSSQEVYATDHLAAWVPRLATLVGAPAGVLAIPISSTPRDYILLFRGEAMRQIRWAGNPQKMVHSDPNAMISPRKSFAVFEQKISGRSHEFSRRDLHCAEVIRSALIEVVLRMSENVDDARRRVVARQEIVIAELNHRVRNILTLMRGLVGQSGTHSGSVRAYVDSLNGRIQSLARAHDRVTRRNWGPALLSSLIEDEIAAYVPNDRDRFVMMGASVWLTPKAFATLALVIHELVTNSCKYGALSASGRVEIDVHDTPGTGLTIKWRERGGPPVTTPERRGFGSVVIERTIPFDLGGTAVVDYDSSGLVAAFRIPPSHTVRDPGTASTASAKIEAGAEVGAAVSQPLLGLGVLLVEDNLIVALEAEDQLRALGAAAVWVASSAPGALAILDRETVQFAMLDINLGVDTSEPVAKHLYQSRIPYVLASGYDDHVSPDTAHANIPLITKPYDRESIRSAASRSLDACAVRW